jgi:3-oxoacyl-[acyl-carrier protein] reductase
VFKEVRRSKVNLFLEGKVALVTGAGGQSGFGRTIALTLAREGCDLVVNYNKNAAGAQKTAAEIKALGRNVIIVKANVCDSPSVKEMVNIAIAYFGKIDVLVNNAGGPVGMPKPFIETPEEIWDADIALNLKGTLICSRAVLDHMVPRKTGKIVNISSMHARTGGDNVCVYESAKAGVIAFTKGLAREVACYGINVNCVAPGFGLTDLTRNGPPETIKYLTEMAPLKRSTTPEDVGYSVAYFASDVSSDVTGQTLAVDGGITMY